MSTDVPGVPGPEAPLPVPAPKKTNWLLIGGIAVAVVALCGCIVCFGSPFILSLMGPNIGASFASTLCQIQYSDLTASDCDAWAQEVYVNNQTEFMECQTSSSSGGSSDTSKMFECLDEKGLGPTTYK